jgi:hypothetical protein
MSAWLWVSGIAVVLGLATYGYSRAVGLKMPEPAERIDPARYVKDPAASGLDFEIWHLDGMDWYKAPPPPRKHACWAQTKGWVDLHQVFRCACGAVSYDVHYWMERNQRNSPETSRLLPGPPEREQAG